MRNIIAVAVTFWLLFAGGASTVQKWLNSNAPQVIVNGASKVIDSQRDQTSPASSPAQRPDPQRTEQPPQIIVRSIPILPTATPIPDIIVVPEPTATPVIALEDDTDPSYPRDPGAENWAMHWVPTRDGSGTQDCVYSYNIMKRYCWEPGIHPSHEDIIITLDNLNNGIIQGEPINSYG